MLSTSLIEVLDHDALVTHAAGHPVLRWHYAARRFRSAWGLGGAAGFTTVGRYGHMLMVVGDAADAGALASEIATSEAYADANGAIEWLTMPVDALGHVSAEIGDGNDWDWFYTTRAPRMRPGESAVELLDADDPAVAAELGELLTASSPRTSAMPGDATVQLWSGVRDARGRLIACAAVSETDLGTPNLRAIAVHPDARGAGLGTDVTAAATRQAFASGAEVVTLGMYADNEPARLVYERLGFRVGQAFASRTVAAPGAISPPAR